MKNFILLTRDGFTSTKNDEPIENMQVLDILEGSNPEDALARFKKSYGKSLESDFDDIVIYELNGNHPLYLTSGE
jgi:hypothetical protein